MINERNDQPQGNALGSAGERISSVPNDLPDNDRDKEYLKSEETIMDLPDVKDIPGQEFVHAPVFGEMADTTISSADEEGANVIGLNDDDGEPDDIAGERSALNRDERSALNNANYIPTRDENNLQRAAMDNSDFDGEALNEGSFGTLQTETDLDIPGSSERVFSGDEENKNFSVDDSDTNESSENRSGL